mmetsp:Transcript_16743/g.23437  ORF Transcript_16743/g.23437 Transcript_16743/m.23437 type:complete len:221 (-) Transcript_16743:210-872(-)
MQEQQAERLLSGVVSKDQRGANVVIEDIRDAYELIGFFTEERASGRGVAPGKIPQDAIHLITKGRYFTTDVIGKGEKFVKSDSPLHSRSPSRFRYNRRKVGASSRKGSYADSPRGSVASFSAYAGIGTGVGTINAHPDSRPISPIAKQRIISHSRTASWNAGAWSRNGSRPGSRAGSRNGSPIQNVAGLSGRSRTNSTSLKKSTHARIGLSRSQRPRHKH